MRHAVIYHLDEMSRHKICIHHPTATHSIERIVIGFACHRPRVNGSVFLWTTIDPTTIASHPVVASGLLYYRFPRMHNVDDEFIEAAVQCHLENFAYQYCQIFLACSGKLHKANASTTLISMRMTPRRARSTLFDEI